MKLQNFLFGIGSAFGIVLALFLLARYTVLPDEPDGNAAMRATFDAHRQAITTHIVCAAVALILGPLQFSHRLRQSRPGLHRLIGYVYLLVGVGVGGAAGLYMSLFASGGTLARIGFGALACAWLYTGVAAFLAALEKDFAAHRAWMVRNFALTFAAVTLRLSMVPLFAMDIPFASFYPVLAWTCWIPNLLAAELWLAVRSAR